MDANDTTKAVPTKTDTKSRKRGSQKSSQSGKVDIKTEGSGGSDTNSYKYVMFNWSGKSASQPVKAESLTKGYALDEYLTQAKDAGLNVLFSGGVIKNKKL